MHTAVGVIGASGYTGVEATRILAAHPRVTLRFAASDKWAGKTLQDCVNIGGAVGGLSYCTLEEGSRSAKECTVVFLATPAEASLEVAPKLLELGIRVIDLSGAFRLRNSELYPQYYQFTHPHPDLLAQAVYGLPELYGDEARGAKLIANPGCFPTGSTLSLAPLLRDGLLEEDSLIIDAASGVTGAGRKSSEDFSFTEVNEDFRAYRVFQHQHTPELAQSFRRLGAEKLNLTFTPHLLPVKRGILTTAYARLKPGVDSARVVESLRAFATQKPFLTWTDSPNAVSLKRVVGTNQVLFSAAVNLGGFDDRRVIVVSAIDNLVKGAAGQAVQNLNWMMGWDETEGLSTLRGFYP